MVTTPNFGFELPLVGGDDSVWGDKLNVNWAALDDLLKDIQDSIAANAVAAQIKVGDLYLSTDAADPATKLGYGTWSAYAAGRALIGVGNNGESDWTPALERGAETHTLVEAEMPAHDHSVAEQTVVTSTEGAHTHQYERWLLGGGGISSGSDRNPSTSTTNSAGAHNHSVTIPAQDTDSKGGDTPHNNVQPSIAIYVWQRVT